jgi:imidazole glycerol-phosphate synthase subunit HisF
VYVKSGIEKLKFNPIEYAKRAEELGAGEILLTSIDNEGLMKGYGYDLVNKIASAVSIPVIANGGARNIIDCAKAINMGPSATGVYLYIMGVEKRYL